MKRRTDHRLAGLERGHVGDRHRDLAWIMQAMFGDPKPDGGYFVCGLLERDEFYSEYERLSGLTIDPERMRGTLSSNATRALVSTLGSCYPGGAGGTNHQDALMIVLKAEAAMASVRLHEMLREVI